MTKSLRIIENGIEHFAEFSKHTPRVFFAPGRANLLGAHMDYNGGVVMPVALSRGTYVFAALRNDNILRISSQQFGGEVIEVTMSDLLPQRVKGWACYIEGALWATHERWQYLGGLDIHVDSDLPIAKGLSSSASVTSAVVKAVASLFDIDTDCDEMIHLSHLAENSYAGVRCGILDQTAVFLGKKDTILIFDCLELTSDYVPLDSDVAQIAIIDSQISRELASSEFNLRVAECASALSTMQKHAPDMICLRELTANQFDEYKDKLSAIEQKRTQHVIDEVQRTYRGAKALRANDIADFGACITAAHYSLRNLLEVSTEELDSIVKAATDVDGCYGARLTGAGFGGCVAALVHPRAKAEFEKHVCDAYKQQAGIQASVEWFSPSDGVCEIEF
ncbi:MAG: galactokinase [Planctomycetes bacterium]|nr:galactokinase [Planctomycetota bacterium]